MLAQQCTVVLFVILTVVYHSKASKLPSYIRPCSRNPETLNECATKEAIRVFPTIMKGDRSLKIPSLNPLKLPQVTLEAGQNLLIKLTDVVIDGFEDFDLDTVDFNQEKNYIAVKVRFPRLNLISQYDINGRILVLPINGHGPANITFVNGIYKYRSDLVSEKRENKEYYKLVNPEISYTTMRSYFYLDNLFGGDKALGEQMNNFLNENWQEVSKELGPALVDVINTIVTTIINAMLKVVPVEDLFID